MDIGAKETFYTLIKKDPIKWGREMLNELGRLEQGIGDKMQSGKDNIYYIKITNTSREKNNIQNNRM